MPSWPKSKSTAFREKEDYFSPNWWGTFSRPSMVDSG